MSVRQCGFMKCLEIRFLPNDSVTVSVIVSDTESAIVEHPRSSDKFNQIIGCLNTQLGYLTF